MISSRRRIIEKRYKGVATVKGTTKTKVNGETVSNPVEIVKDQPCSLIQLNPSPVQQTEVKATIINIYKILMAPEIDVPPGSEITVTQKGVTYNLSNSGKPLVCETHQEISAKEEAYA